MPETIDYVYLIVGGGMVADSAARGIREIDSSGSIGIIAEEEAPPVARPALTKKLWTDSDFTFDKVLFDGAPIAQNRGPFSVIDVALMPGRGGSEGRLLG